MFRKFSGQRHCVIAVIISGQEKVVTTCSSVLNQQLLVLNKYERGASLVLWKPERY